MSADTTRVRLFVGLKPPAEIAERLCASVASALGGASEWRLYRPEHLHLTLCFLGLVEPERATELESMLAREIAGLERPTILIAGTGAFPSLAKPRVLWAGVRGEPVEIERLQLLSSAAVRAAIAAGTPPVGARNGSGDVKERAVKDKREPAFTPHLTLARPTKDAVWPRMPAAFAELAFTETWTPDAVVLFESRIETTSTERYPARARFPLS